MRRVPQSMRANRRELDLQLILRAAAGIAEINAGLDRAVGEEPSEAGRMRRLREATNQIVRHANDAIQAYRRAMQATSADIAAGRGEAADHERTREEIRRARAAVLSELAKASHRYPWAAPWPEAVDEVTTAPVGRP